MKKVGILCLVLLVSTSLSQMCLPFNLQGSNTLYSMFGNNVYMYSLPDLNVQLQKKYTFDVCPPGSIESGSFVASTTIDGVKKSSSFSTTDLSLLSSSDDAAPQGDYPYFMKYGSGCVVDGTDKYCFSYDKSSLSSTLQHLSNGYPVEILRLPKNDTSASYISIDSEVEGRLHLATQTCTKDGCAAMTYYKISTNPLVISSGPVTLSKTENNNCPTEPLKCGVSVLLDMHAQNDMITYVWSQSNVVTLQNYDARCNLMYTTIQGQSSNAVAGRCSQPVVAVSTPDPTSEDGGTGTAARSNGSKFTPSALSLVAVVFCAVLLL